jgi:hypothetical protein
MTTHRLIRCAPSALLDSAYIGHPLVEDRASDALHHWRRPAESERGNAVHWYDHVPVIGDVGCCLWIGAPLVRSRISLLPRLSVEVSCQDRSYVWRCRPGLIASSLAWRKWPSCRHLIAPMDRDRFGC